MSDNEQFKMTTDNNDIPNVAEILAGLLRTIEPLHQPLLLAKLEKMAAVRYRRWADEHADPIVKAGLLACADREDEIAKRVESLEPDAIAIQDQLMSANPDLVDLNRTLFEGRPFKVQFAMQAEGERAGAAAWNAYGSAAPNESAQELLRSCSALEQANADFLQTLL